MMIACSMTENCENCSVLCCVYDSCAQWYLHTYEQFLKMSVGLGLGIVVGWEERLQNGPFCVEWDVKP